MAKIPIRIITDSNDRNPTAGLIDRRFGMSADWVTADSSSAGGVLPISLSEFQAASANFMQSLAGETPAAWYQFNNGITVTGSGVSQWNDQSGNGRHLLQGTDAKRPPKQTDGSILFDGVAQYLQATFTLNQPETVYVLLKQITWTAGNYLFDGGVDNTMFVQQNLTTPKLRAYAGTVSAENSNLALNTYDVVYAVFNGASSVFGIGTTTALTGNYGANNGGGLTLGAQGAVPASFGNCRVKEAIVFASAHSAAVRSRIVAYLKTL